MRFAEVVAGSALVTLANTFWLYEVALKSGPISAEQLLAQLKMNAGVAGMTILVWVLVCTSRLKRRNAGAKL